MWLWIGPVYLAFLHVLVFLCGTNSFAFLAESLPLQSVDIDDENVEEEFKMLEMELAEEMPQPQFVEPVAKGAKEVKAQESVDSLSKTLSNLNLEAV